MTSRLSSGEGLQHVAPGFPKLAETTDVDTSRCTRRSQIISAHHGVCDARQIRSSSFLECSRHSTCWRAFYTVKVDFSNDSSGRIASNGYIPHPNRVSLI